ncbi:biopolymer transporter ExbD [Pirellulales bacterium]|nr:biopolymer transporter ExbD [Pirellulales bacterium]
MPLLDDIDDLDVAPPQLSDANRHDDAEMDVTPMIDVTFLLLIFFIVCSTTDQQASIELAKAKHGKGISERESVVIVVEKGGIDSAPVSLEESGKLLSSDPEEQKEEIRKAVEKAKQDPVNPKLHVLIKADRNVACRDVEQVVKGISRVEGMHIHLAVLEND